MVDFLDQSWGLQSSLYGITLENLVFYALFVIIFLIIGRALEFVLIKYGKALASRTQSDWDDLIVDALAFPIRYITLILGLSVGGKLFLTFSDAGTESFYYQMVGLISLGIILWTVLKIIDLFSERIILRWASKTKSRLDDQLVPLVKRALKYLVIILGVLLALDNFGFDITALLAGLGIGGLAVAFAAQETIKDVFGGLTIFANKSFFVGDYVTFLNNGISGKVIAINLRTTRLRNAEGRVVTIPNSQVAASQVENWSAAPGRRTHMTIALAPYLNSEQVERAKEIVRSILKKNKRVVQDTEKDQKITIWMADLLLNTLNLNVIYFVTEMSEPQQVWDEVNTAIKKELEIGKIAIATTITPPATPVRAKINKSKKETKN